MTQNATTLSTQHRGIAPRLAGAVLLALSLVWMGCDTTADDSLWPPEGAQTVADPVITSLSPADSALAGVSTITINGQNFSPVAAENTVLFNARRATILEASPTRLVVQAPNLPQAGLQVKVGVAGALNYSNTRPYTLSPVVVDFSDVQGFEEPFAITSDAQGNLYASFFSNNVSAGILKITPSGTRALYANTRDRWDDLLFNADGSLYGVRGVRAIFQLTPGASAPTTWAVIPNTSARFFALARDAAGNVWAGGAGGQIYRVAPDRTIAGFDFAPVVQALAVSGDFLYAAATEGTSSKVYRIPITPGGLGGTSQVLLDVTAAYGVATEAVSLAFFADGDLVVGTTGPSSLIVVKPDGDHAPLYPAGVLPAPATSLAWGSGSYLYMTVGRADKVEPNLVRINTLRQGAR